MEHFTYFLMGRRFTVQSDHKALETFNTKGTVNAPRIQRWMDRIQLYDFEVKYTKPEFLAHVDALSRCHLEVNGIEATDNSECIIKVHEGLVHRGSKQPMKKLAEDFQKEELQWTK